MWVDGPFLFIYFCWFVGVPPKRLNVIEPH